MKIVCSCGNEVKIIGEGFDIDGCEHASLETYNKIDIHGEHDEVWVTCIVCGNSYHLFT